MPPDVALGQRAVDRVGDRVHPHVGVRMARPARVVRHLDAAEHDVVAGAEGVHVEAVAGCGRPCAPPAVVSARAKSSGTVIFRLRSSPGTIATSSPAARATSTSSAAPPRMGAVRGEDRRRSGTPAASAPARGRRGRTVPRRARPSPRQSASVTGRAGAAPSARRPARATTRAISAWRHAGAGDVVDQHPVEPVSGQRLEPRAHARARVAPPTATITSGWAS